MIWYSVLVVCEMQSKPRAAARQVRGAGLCKKRLRCRRGASMLARLDETQECSVAWYDRVDWRLDAEGGGGDGAESHRVISETMSQVVIGVRCRLWTNDLLTSARAG